MQNQRKQALGIAVLAALGLGAAQPAEATGPVVDGSGFGELILDEGFAGLKISVIDLPDGSTIGRGVSYRRTATSGDAWFRFDAVEYLLLDDRMFVVGIVTEAQNTPGDWVGTWCIVGIQDNGSGEGAPDRVVDTAGIPPFVTLEEIEEVLALPPDQGGPPPVEFWYPLSFGDLVIH